jgi:hypothetical protein
VLNLWPRFFWLPAFRELWAHYAGQSISDWETLFLDYRRRRWALSYGHADIRHGDSQIPPRRARCGAPVAVVDRHVAVPLYEREGVAGGKAAIRLESRTCRSGRGTEYLYPTGIYPIH